MVLLLLDYVIHLCAFFFLIIQTGWTKSYKAYWSSWDVKGGKLL